MAEDFQTEICGGAWWINPARSSSSLSPCSAAGIGMNDHMGNFLWSSNDMKTTAASTITKSCEESNNSVSADSSSLVFQKQTDSDSGGSSNILMDSTLQMMNFVPSSSASTDWNQALLHGNGRAENNYRTMMLEDLNSQIQNEWSPKSLTSAGDQDLSAGFPVNSASYGYTSALLQSYFEPDPQPAPLCNNRSMNYMSSTANYGTNSDELSPSWPKFAAPLIKPSIPKQQPSGLHFSNNTPFWNASADTALGEKSTTCDATLTAKYNTNEAKKGSSEPASFKRPRIETPSPLPTFKVRKEKLGDRITALQQLVSPFGKVLTTPYMKQGTQIPQQQSCDYKEPAAEARKQDLNSRGLCLVPISSTFPVANETTADFWTPTFGGTSR